MTAPRRLQVLLRARPGAPLVAGLPCVVRAAYRAGYELRPERIIIVGSDDSFRRRWSFQLRAAGAPVKENLDPDRPLLIISEDAFPDEHGLVDFLTNAEETQNAVRLSADGRPIAAYRRTPPAAGSPDEAYERAFSAPAAEISSGAFFDASTPKSAAAAAQTLYARLVKDNDGYIARFDRTLSLAITRLLLPGPVTPNQVTAASLLLGLLGAWWLAAPSAATQFQGALLLWFCCLLDGSDGEIARLKYLSTPWGGNFDLWADHIAHLATFVALPVGAARLHPGLDLRLPGFLLVTGFLTCVFSVWHLVLRIPERERGPLALVVERLASRDYVYLIVALAAVGRTDLFVWAAAAGSHAFWAWLWWRRPSVKPNPMPSAPRALPRPSALS